MFTFEDGKILEDVFRLDWGSGTVGIIGIGCFIMVGIVTVVGICGKAGEITEGGVTETRFVPISTAELQFRSPWDISNIFLAFARFISALETSVSGIVALLFVPSLLIWEGPDNLTVVLGLDARLGGSDFKGLLLGDGAKKKKNAPLSDRIPLP